ncbi:N-acetylmuramoyl-L-alanine amidase [Clostridium sp.]|uniref:N-acetylmuramoyl-L-alanine amidase n=1 Tax=Clostridium sp. TaxID=1506 RepID=UPI003F2FAA7A
MRNKIRFLSLVLVIGLLVNFIGSTMTKALMLKEESSKKFTVCIDPGHQEKGDPKGEAVAPGSGNKKARVSAGTKGVGTKKNEYVVNLEASLILRDILKENDYNVIMTREVHNVNISNAERAKVANDANADMTIRIHCDSVNDCCKKGATILVPSKSGKHTSSIYEKSFEYAEILKKNLKESGIKVNGIIERDDITGFNWSTVPVIILEMGFMSNWEEDKMLADTNYQKKLMDIVTKSLDQYKESK